MAAWRAARAARTAAIAMMAPAVATHELGSGQGECAIALASASKATAVGARVAKVWCGGTEAWRRRGGGQRPWRKSADGPRFCDPLLSPPLGCQVFKGFSEVFRGTVESSREMNRQGTLFKVVYDDGDEEELTARELDATILHEKEA